jgi:1,4-dihydroxy-2-naphthoyl-CoA hydrolase
MSGPDAAAGNAPAGPAGAAAADATAADATAADATAADATAADATAAMHDAIPFARTLGITMLRYSPAEVRARLEWASELCTSGGVLHGGVIMALADNTGAMCAFRNLPDGAAGTTTVESKTNFLRAVRGGFIEATSRLLHGGRTLLVIETDIRDDQDRLVARVTQSQLVLSAEDPHRGGG